MQAVFSMVAALLTASLPAHAQDPAPAFPDKPIKFIVPVTAGGGVDTAARLVANQLKSRLGQAVIVENKPGAGGNIGLRQLASSTPDGYTLAFVPNSFTINHSLMRNLPFDTFASFAPVIQIAKAPVFVAARADFPASTLQEVVSLAKNSPAPSALRLVTRARHCIYLPSTSSRQQAPKSTTSRSKAAPIRCPMSWAGRLICYSSLTPTSKGICKASA